MFGLFSKAIKNTIGRSIFILIVSVVATYVFLESRAEFSSMHKWNRALADTGVLFLAISMAIGPTSKLWSSLRRMVIWRREIGVIAFFFALAHTAVILAGWIEWDFIKLFGYIIHPETNEYVMLLHGFGLANTIGILALVYGLVLSLTSNNFSQKFLGGVVWKFIQRGVYVFWWLIVIHTGYFLYLHFLDFHRPVPEPNWVQMPFAMLILLVVALQLIASWKMWQTGRSDLLIKDVA
jgi:methionine sulfoxide reductase heme-binding subunit